MKEKHPLQKLIEEARNKNLESKPLTLKKLDELIDACDVPSEEEQMQMISDALDVPAEEGLRKLKQIADQIEKGVKLEDLEVEIEETLENLGWFE